MGLFSGISNLLGGGAPDMSGIINQGRQALGQQYDQGLGYLNPYMQAGQNAMGGYQNFLNQYGDPTHMYNDIMSHYSMSPGAQFQMQQGTQAANAAAAANGMLGSGAEQKALMQYGQGIANQDQQQYLNNILGMGNTYLNGMGNLMGQGFGAANAANQNRMGYGNALGQLYGGQAQAQAYGQQNLLGNIGNIISGGIGLFSGGGPLSGMFGGHSQYAPVPGMPSWQDSVNHMFGIG